MDLEPLLGPAGALVGAVAVIAVLWREHLKADKDDRDQRDRALGLVEGIVPTVKTMAGALEAINRRAANRGRADDETA